VAARIVARYTSILRANPLQPVVTGCLLASNPVYGSSISTSFSLLIRRPPAAGSGCCRLAHGRLAEADDVYTARAATTGPGGSRGMAPGKHAGTDILYTALATTSQPSPAGCWGMAPRKLAGADDLYTAWAVHREKALARCMGMARGKRAGADDLKSCGPLPGRVCGAGAGSSLTQTITTHLRCVRALACVRTHGGRGWSKRRAPAAPPCFVRTDGPNPAPARPTAASVSTERAAAVRLLPHCQGGGWSRPSCVRAVRLARLAARTGPGLWAACSTSSAATAGAAAAAPSPQCAAAGGHERPPRALDVVRRSTAAAAAAAASVCAFRRAWGVEPVGLGPGERRGIAGRRGGPDVADKGAWPVCGRRCGVQSQRWQTMGALRRKRKEGQAAGWAGTGRFLPRCQTQVMLMCSGPEPRPLG
jgi:hypothetical protein